MLTALLAVWAWTVPQDRPLLDLSGYGPRELIDVVRHAQRRLTRVLLEVRPELLDEHAELLALPDTGIVRLLDRESPIVGETQVDGGGAWVDFELGIHTYNAGRDLGLERNAFRTYDEKSWVLDLEDFPLEYLPAEPGPPPIDLDEERERVWHASWQALGADDPVPEGAGERAVAETGATFLLRTREAGHDLLVGVHVVDSGVETRTVLYRILRHFPDLGPRRNHDHDPGPEPRVDEALAAWVDGADRDELVALLARAREAGLDRLLAVDPEAVAPYRELFAGRASFAQRSGSGRITTRGPWEALESSARTGYTYRFQLADNGSWNGADLYLTRNGLQAYAPGGLLLELGKLGLDELERPANGRAPADLQPAAAEAWKLLHTHRPERDEHGRPTPLEAPGEYGLAKTLDPIRGHSYLLRSISDDRDLLVLFTVVDQDADGITIAWKILESFAPR